MGFLSKLFGALEPTDVLRTEIVMDFDPMIGRGSAVVRWVPIVSADAVGLSPFLVALLYARVLTVHTETRSQLFSLIGELSKRNVREKGATGFAFPEWTLSIAGIPPQHIWPWDLSRDVPTFADSKTYVATLQAFQPQNEPGHFGIDLGMAFGLERVLAPATVLLAIDSYVKSTDQQGIHELALFLWQINEFYGSPDGISLGQEKAALAAATAALRSCSLRLPGEDEIAAEPNVTVRLSEVTLNYSVHRADNRIGELAESPFGDQLHILHFSKGSVTPPIHPSFFLVPSSEVYFEVSAAVSRAMKARGVIAVCESVGDSGLVILEPLDGGLHAIRARDRGKATALESPRLLQDFDEWQRESGASLDAEMESLAMQLVAGMTIEP